MSYTTAATVIVPGKFTFKIGLATADQIFTCDASGVHLSSDPQTTTVAATLCADGYDDVASVRHALTVDFQGFLDEAMSLFYFLWDNGGQNGLFEFTGTIAGATTPMSVTGPIRLVKPPLDAIAGEVVTGSVTLPCTAEPTITKPVLAATTAAATTAAAAAAPASAGK